jgi:acetyl esterase
MCSERPSQRQFGRGYLLELEAIRYFQHKYLAHARDYGRRASPLLRTSWPGAAGADRHRGLRPAGGRLHRLRRPFARGGVDVEYRCFDGMIHGFLTLGKMFADSGKAIEFRRARWRAFGTQSRLPQRNGSGKERR